MSSTSKSHTLADELATVEAVLSSGGTTRRMDAFTLMWVKAEKQLSHLFYFLNIFFAIIMSFYFIGHTSWLYAAEVTKPDMLVVQRLIETYGTKPIVRVIHNKRKSQITIEVNGQLRNMYGVPDSIYLTPRSILSDIEQAGLTIESFGILVKEEKEKIERDEMAAESQRQEPPVPPMAAVPNKGEEIKKIDQNEGQTIIAEALPAPLFPVPSAAGDEALPAPLFPVPSAAGIVVTSDKTEWGILTKLILLALAVLAGAIGYWLRRTSASTQPHKEFPKIDSKKLVLLTFAIGSLLLLFPPFYYKTNQRQWHFLLDARHIIDSGSRTGLEGNLDVSMLLLELALLGVSIGAAYYVLGHKSDQ